MTTFQKIIKYLAIAFAFYLVASIITISYRVFNTIASHVDDNEYENSTQSNINSIINDYKDIDVANLDINLKSVNLEIKTGENLSVETDNKYITCTQEENKIFITEEKHGISLKDENIRTIIYVPADMEFESVKIDAGAGKSKIENLTTKKLDLQVGAGKFNIEKLNVFEDSNIECGAGKITIDYAKFNELNLDLGVGKATINAEILSNSKMNVGVGKLDIKILGDKEDYKIDVSKGLGSVKIDGENMKDKESFGKGDITIKLDDGIGSIELDFNK